MRKRENLSDYFGVKKMSVEDFIKLCGYISIPLVLLIVSTIVISYTLSGNINSNVNNTDSFVVMLLNFSMPMVIVLGVIPLFLLKCTSKVSWNELGFVVRKGSSYVICMVCTIVVIVCSFQLSKQSLDISLPMVLVHFFCVAVAEEIMLRSIIYYNTSKVFGKVLNCMINGLIFAFIYHSNEDFISNLIIRFPLGFVLAIVRMRQDDIYPSIGIHWMYNVLVSAM